MTLRRAAGDRMLIRRRIGARSLTDASCRRSRPTVQLRDGGDEMKPFFAPVRGPSPFGPADRIVPWPRTMT